jgi:calcium-dependent protein kinase
MEVTTSPQGSILGKTRSDMVQIGKYCFGKKYLLGKGALSEVYKACDPVTKELMAIKRIEKKKITSEFLLDALMNEIMLLKKFDHPNIVKFLDLVQTPNHIYLVLEYCNCGTLKEYMADRAGLPEIEATAILGQVLQGIRALTNANVCHRDLKPDNILCHIANSRMTFKIADLGFSKEIIEEKGLLQSGIGSPQYMGLQRLSNEPYSNKADVFSFGVIAYEMLYGKAPWNGSNLEDIKNNLKDKPLEFPLDPEISDKYRNFLQKTLAIEETDRLSWDEVYIHQIFTT